MQEDRQERAADAEKENEDAGEDDSSESYSEDEDDGEPLTDYERLRKKNIHRNERVLQDLGFKPPAKASKKVRSFLISCVRNHHSIIHSAEHPPPSPTCLSPSPPESCFANSMFFRSHQRLPQRGLSLMKKTRQERVVSLLAQVFLSFRNLHVLWF